MGFTPPFHYLILPLYALIMAIPLGLSGLLAKWIQEKTKWPQLFIFPWCFIFFWTQVRFLFDVPLATSQIKFLSILQPIDFTGAIGLDFLIVSVNIAIYLILKRNNPTQIKLAILTLFCFFSWALWGYLQLNNWRQKQLTYDIKKIGIVQPNRIASLDIKESIPGFRYDYPWELNESYKLSKQGAGTIIWPEGHFFGYHYSEKIKDSFDFHFKQIKANILFEDQSFVLDHKQKKTYRTLSWVNSTGNITAKYHKNILVPFGEYLPLYEYLSPIYHFLNVPVSNLDAGEHNTFFYPDNMIVAPVICRESLNFELVGKKVGKNGKGKVIIVVSQDGWYGNSLIQVTQHSNVTNLRAIENRTPLVHVIANGPSYAITATGDLVFKTPHLTRGSWIINLAYSKTDGGSFFSQHPGWFLTLTNIIVFFFIFISLILTVRVTKHT